MREDLTIGGAQLQVVVDAFVRSTDLRLGQISQGSCRNSYCQGPRWDLFAFWKESAGRQPRTLSHDPSVEDPGTDSNETSITDGRSVHDGLMTDRNPAPDPYGEVLIDMHNDVVLKVRLLADFDRRQLGTRNDSEHENSPCTDDHIPMYLRVGRHKSSRIDDRLGQFDRSHPRLLQPGSWPYRAPFLMRIIARISESGVFDQFIQSCTLERRATNSSNCLFQFLRGHLFAMGRAG